MCRSSATASTAAIPTRGHCSAYSTSPSAHMSATIDLRPYIAPHTLKLGPDGLIYITCENSAVVAVIDRKTNKVVGAIDSGSTNGHRLIISPDGQRLYTENEEDGDGLGDRSAEDASCSARSRRRSRSPASPSRPTAAPWSRSTTQEPVLFLIDTESRARHARRSR